MSIYIECVFSMELYVLLEGYVSLSVPESNFLCAVSIAQILQRANLQASAGFSAEVYAVAYFVVSNAQVPGAWFLPVSLAIAEASVPSAVFNFIAVWSGGVLPVFAEYIELLNRDVQVNTQEFRFGVVEQSVIMDILEGDVVYAQFSEVEVISAASEVEISLIVISSCFNKATIEVFISYIKLTKAGSQIQFAIVVSCLCTIIALSIAIEPAALVTESDGLTAKTYGEVFAEVMIYKELFSIGAVCGIIFEAHICSEASICIGRVINLCFSSDTDTAIPSVFSFAFSIYIIIVCITHTSVAGPVNVADFLFQVGNANAQVSQFVSVFASQFVEGCTLFSVQLVFFSHEAGNDLSQFITGNVSFAFEGAVRIAFYNALVGEVGYCLVSPVIGGNIGERICGECGNASGECSCSCDCENLFHSSSLLVKKIKRNVPSIFSTGSSALKFSRE